MSVAERFRAAWPTTFGIHVFQSLLAASFAVPLVGSVGLGDGSMSPGTADALAAMRLSQALDGETARRMVLPLLAAGLNYPWLSVAWLRAMREPGSFLQHARYALGRYVAAALIAAAALLGIALLTAGAGATLHGLGKAYGARLDDRTCDVLRLATLVPFAWLAAWLLTLQDGAYAAVSGGTRSLRAAFGAALRSVDARRVLLRIAVVIAQAVVTALAWAAPRVTLGAGARAAAVVLIVTQVSALALTCARANWLSYVAGWDGERRARGSS